MRRHGIALAAGLMLSIVVGVGGCDSASSNAGTGSSAGTTGGAGTASSAGTTGSAGTGGVAGGAARGELIHGDAATCPQRVPTPASACAAGGAACTYQGGDFGISTLVDPVTCFCPSAVWVCLVTDSVGTTSCPIEDPPVTPCQSGLACTYAERTHTSDCRCMQGPDGGGAGGAPWLCGA